MSCIQVTLSQVLPSTSVSKISASSGLSSQTCHLPLRINKPVLASLMLAANVLKYQKKPSVMKYKHRVPVCLFAGGGKSENNAEGSEWKPLEAAASPEKKSIEEVLREQIEKREYAADPSVGGGGKPPRGRGGGSGRGRGRGWGDESEGKDMNEALQVTLATIGFVLVYLSTIHGEDVLLLARDYIRYFSTGNRTVRLRKFMEWFNRRRLPFSLFQKKSVPQGIEEDEDNDEDTYAYQ
jgi:hypothetical protein